jgi:Tol biopolymer transport system component
MTVPRDPDRLIHAFLDEGPTRLADRTIDRTLGEIHRSHRRAGIGPWRTNLMSRPAIAAIAAAVVIAAAAVWAVRSSPAVGSASSPSPQSSATSVGAPSPSPTATPAPSATGPNLGARSGTILYSLEDQLTQTSYAYTISPLSPTSRPGAPVATTQACCLSLTVDGTGFVFGTGGGVVTPRSTAGYARLDGSLSENPDTLTPLAGVDVTPGAISPSADIALEGWGTSDPRKNGVYVSIANGGGSIWGDIRRVTSPTGGIHDVPLGFSPDGTRILFIRDTHDDGRVLGDLYTVSLDGSSIHQLNPKGVYVRYSDAFGSGASWSPDGTQIAFAGFPTGGADGDSMIYVAPASAGLAVAITDTGTWSTSARWSPDGTWIAFDKAVGASLHGIFIVHPDGSGLVSITPGNPVGMCCGVWSPDGSALVVQGTTTSSDLVDLYLAAADGSGTVPLTHAPGRYNTYVWSPATP